MKKQWRSKYGKGCKFLASQKLGFLQYKFYNTKGVEINLQEEIEKNQWWWKARPKAVKESMDIIMPSIEHGLEILLGLTGECARK